MIPAIAPSPADLRAIQSGDARGFTQRWRYGTPTWRHVSDGGFRAERYAVTAVPEATAKSFVQRHHYLSGWPAVLHHPYGLLDQEAPLCADDLAVGGLPLVGVLVLASPMSKRVLTTAFPHLEPYRESAEIARLVLSESVPSNGESFFTAAALRSAAGAGLRGAVMFSDPVPRWRLTEYGHAIQTRGHLGIVYQSLSATYTGRGTARTLTVLPDGSTFTARARSKLLRQESGAAGVARRLEQMGAPPPPPDPGEPLRQWLDQALAQIGARRLPHPGNHRYVLRVGRTRAERSRTVIGLMPHPYPKDPAARPEPAAQAAPATSHVAAGRVGPVRAWLHGVFLSDGVEEFEGTLEDPDSPELTPYLYWAPEPKAWFLAHGSTGTDAQLVYEAITAQAARSWLVGNGHDDAAERHFG